MSKLVEGVGEVPRVALAPSPELSRTTPGGTGPPQGSTRAPRLVQSEAGAGLPAAGHGAALRAPVPQDGAGLPGERRGAARRDARRAKLGRHTLRNSWFLSGAWVS